MKKQYVIKKTYNGNSRILQYVDRRYDACTIVAYYEVSGYVSALENMGYKRAYYEKEFLARIRNLEEALKDAKEMYQNVQGCFLDLSTEEAEKYERLTYFDENEY